MENFAKSMICSIFYSLHFTPAIMKHVQFVWMDYAIFGIMFSLSLLVGVYFWWFGKQDTTEEYLQGGKRMKVFPVAMSLVASTFSGISLMAMPAEIYVYGTQYWMTVLAAALAGFIIYFTFLPVFYKLQLTSVFEYLEIRYDKSLRTLFSVFFSLTALILLPVVIYAPSLAFNQVTGFSIYFIAAIMSLICLFYTVVGGVKAVIWADTLQLTITLCTLAFVLIKGMIFVGGSSVIWNKAEKGDRIEFFNINWDPTVRNTFWSVVVGNAAIWMNTIGNNQATMQRYLAVPTYGDSKKILITCIVFTIVTKSILCFSGLIIYAKYSDCDPLRAGYIHKPDQILPYFVADVAVDVPGLTGLFVCSLFTTALSALSTAFNSISATLYADIVCLFTPTDTSEKTNTTILKIVTFLIGLITLGLVFVVDKLGTILKVFTSAYGLTGGPLLGLYLMGMIFPMVNRKGALYGAISSLLIMIVLVVGNQVTAWNNLVATSSKPLHTYGCSFSAAKLWNTTASSSTTDALNAEMTSTLASDIESKRPLWLFNISFHYYTFIGVILTVTVGLIASWITRSDTDAYVKPDLLCPFAQRLFKKALSKKHTCHHITPNKKENEPEENVLVGLLKK